MRASGVQMAERIGHLLTGNSWWGVQECVFVNSCLKTNQMEETYNLSGKSHLLDSIGDLAVHVNAHAIYSGVVADL